MIKQKVHYDLNDGISFEKDRAFLVALDHPNAPGTYPWFVKTSKVVSYDEITGILETRNTIYYPKEVE